jgi:DeoR family fructose operon transcriptional repressor
MNIKPRQKEILQQLKTNGYATVKSLIDVLHYSSATINRDLNTLQALGLVKRTHGGVELTISQYVPIPFRNHLMRTEKRKIGKLSASFVDNGDVIFIDASTTAQCMEQFLVGKKDLTVITNNTFLAGNLAGAGIKAVCLGGEIVEPPSMLGGTDTVLTAMRYKVDKMFFSTKAVSQDGFIASGEVYDVLLKTVAKQSSKVFYLVDKKKLDKPFNTIYANFEEVDFVISDFEFPITTKDLYKNTKFYTVKD